MINRAGINIHFPMKSHANKLPATAEKGKRCRSFWWVQHQVLAAMLCKVYRLQNQSRACRLLGRERDKGMKKNVLQLQPNSTATAQTVSTRKDLSKGKIFMIDGTPATIASWSWKGGLADSASPDSVSDVGPGPPTDERKRIPQKRKRSRNIWRAKQDLRPTLLRVDVEDC